MPTEPSDAQKAANAANAQKSTGPKTEEGKRRCRLNAYRHGLTGQVCFFTPEEQAAFDKHCNGICAALDPVGAIETYLAQSIAEDYWRLARARFLEGGIFAIGHPHEEADSLGQTQIDEAVNQARTWLNEGKNLQLLALYEQRIRRASEKNMAALRGLQAERKAVRKQALEDAQLLAQLAFIKGEQYYAAQDFPAEAKIGSDFSTAGIARLITQTQRLSEARFYAKNRWETATAYPKPGVSVAAA